MPEFFSSIDILVAPSLCSESFGLITREAMWAGLWVVASNKGGLAEDIEEGINGNIFNPDHKDELINILQKIDQNPTYYDQSFSGNKKIKTIEQQVQELDSLYQQILNDCHAQTFCE